MTIHMMEQRSPEWHQIRAGKLTSSCAEAILRERKRGSGELAIRADLRRRLACERLTGVAEDGPTSPDMRRGVEMEDAAFAAYEWATGMLAERVGFIEHDELKAGCSPDGVLYRPDGSILGGVELKCPRSLTHLGYLRGGAIPEEYRAQIIHDLWITGADWWDFVSYDDRMPAGLRLFRVRLEAAAVDLAAYELAARLLLSEVDREYDEAVAMAAARLLEAV